MVKTVPGAHLLAQTTQKTFIPFIRYVHAWRQYKTIKQELSKLSDRELTDIGINRADIDRVASGSVDPTAVARGPGTGHGRPAPNVQRRHCDDEARERLA